MSGCAAACDPSSAASQVLGLQVGASMPGWQGRGLVNGVNKRTVFQQRLALLHHCSLALCFFSVFFYIEIYLLFVRVCAGMFAPKCVCLGQKTTFESQCSPYTGFQGCQACRASIFTVERVHQPCLLFLNTITERLGRDAFKL